MTKNSMRHYFLHVVCLMLWAQQAWTYESIKNPPNQNVLAMEQDEWVEVSFEVLDDDNIHTVWPSRNGQCIQSVQSYMRFQLVDFCSPDMMNRHPQSDASCTRLIVHIKGDKNDTNGTEIGLCVIGKDLFRQILQSYVIQLVEPDSGSTGSGPTEITPTVTTIEITSVDINQGGQVAVNQVVPPIVVISVLLVISLVGNGVLGLLVWKCSKKNKDPARLNNMARNQEIREV